LSKIKVYHFHNGTGGGVLSVIRNLLTYSSNEVLENHVIFTINKDLVDEYEMPKLEGAVTQQLLYYSAKWNFYYTCKQLAKLLPDEKAIVVAHDWMELGMMSNLGLQNPVVQVAHGNYEYYYDLAKKHNDTIDRFICISPVIYNKLCAILPDRKKEIHYCRFPVPSVEPLEKNNEILKIFYCVRSLHDENKQFALLPLISEKIVFKNLNIDWTIIGAGMERQEVENLMHQHSGIFYYPTLPNEKVIELLPQHDLFILPSLKEGFPVAVVEAMKAGLVPLVTNWEGATDELIVQGETGFYFEAGDVNGYANKIESLNGDRIILKEISEAGRKRANELFDPMVNTRAIEEIICAAFEKNVKDKKALKVYGSRLDQEWILNTITHSIRKILKQ
jgi:glycosyltransferase involved in cell wall biosynthesis